MDSPYARMVALPESEYLDLKATRPQPVSATEQADKQLYQLAHMNLPPDQLLKLQGHTITRMQKVATPAQPDPSPTLHRIKCSLVYYCSVYTGE